MTDDDGNAWEVYRSLHKISQEKRANNRENAIKILTNEKFEFSVHNDGAHILVSTPRGRVNFWPGTGLYEFNGNRGRGIFGMIKLVRSLKNAG